MNESSQSLDRVDAIIRALLQDECRPKPASEIASITTLSLSTAVRHLSSMCAIGWARRDGELYALGENLIHISRAYVISLHNAVRRIRLEVESAEMGAHEILETS